MFREDYDLFEYDVALSFAAQLEEKIKQIRHRPGPPTQSHDLRSGNIPPIDPDQEDYPNIRIE